jgi:hypothetical protein
MHSRWIAANGSSISAWTPSTSLMRSPEACRAAYRSISVFPMPGSPRITRTALCPSRARVSTPSR